MAKQPIGSSQNAERWLRCFIGSHSRGICRYGSGEDAL